VLHGGAAVYGYAGFVLGLYFLVLRGILLEGIRSALPVNTPSTFLGLPLRLCMVFALDPEHHLALGSRVLLEIESRLNPFSEAFMFEKRLMLVVDA
jgi:hypothetical protein